MTIKRNKKRRQCKTTVIYETIDIFSYLRHLIQNKCCLYCEKSLLVILFEKVFNALGFFRDQAHITTKLSKAHVAFLNNVDKLALKRADSTCDELLVKHSEALRKTSRMFGIKFDLILRKYLLSNILYNRYLFHELAFQYAIENPDNKVIFKFHRLFSEEKHLTCYVADNTKLTCKSRIYELLIAIILIPVILMIRMYKCRPLCVRPFNDRMICITTNYDQYICYNDLFGEIYRPIYLIPPSYLKDFDENQLEEINGIATHIGMTKKNRKRIIGYTLAYLNAILKHYRLFDVLGIHTAFLYNRIFTARLMAPSGSGNLIVAFEHHDTIKTIRNEFIRAEKSRTLFFSYLLGVSLRYYPEEYFSNYDYICLSGEYLREQLIENRAITDKFLTTGAYFTHRYTSSDRVYYERIDQLKRFKEVFNTITILCPGICDETHIAEKQLMELAVRLSSCKNFRIFIRQKPFKPEEKYARFYETYTDENPSIWLTGMEFDLFDFMDVTDLFITSFSSSACDVASRGGNIFFIDLLKHTDRFMFWQESVSNGLVLNESDALDSIKKWFDQYGTGNVPQPYAERLRRFREYIECRHDTYELYHQRLLQLFEENGFPYQLKGVRSGVVGKN